MDPSPSPPSPLPDPRFGTAREQIAAFTRLLAIAPLYPSDHSRFGAAVAELRTCARREHGASSPLGVEVHAEGIAVGSVLLDLDEREAARLHELLHPLGIDRIEVAPDASDDDLHQLAIALVRSVQPSGAPLAGTSPLLAQLPSTLAVRHREFGRRVAGPTEIRVDHDRLRSALERIEAQLRLRGDASATVEDSCDFAGRFLARVAERLERNPEPWAPGAEGLGRGLDEVLDLCAFAIGKAMEEVADAGFEDLSRLFDAAETALALSEDRETVNVMLEVLRDAGAEAITDGAGKRKKDATAGDEEPNSMSAEELADTLQEIAAPDLRLDPPAPRETEGLSVLLHLLLRDPAAREGTGLAHHLERSLVGRGGNDTHEMLHAALETLFGEGDAPLIDRGLARLAAVLHKSNPHGWVRLLVHTSHGGAGARDGVWPHLINELLAGRVDEDAPLAELVVARLRGLEPARAATEAGRLTRLSALRSRRLSAAAFSIATPLAPLFAALLENTGDTFLGNWALRGLRRHPPPLPGVAALATRERFDALARPLVIALLTEYDHEEASSNLRRHAARVTLDALARLDSSRRAEAWVAPAIEELGSLEGKKIEAVLHRVLTERRFLVPRWPRECREAARRARRAFREPQ